ncbi:MAG: hypothetical protein E7650_01610 [Ruminococcaceae bacterium]|nr:hypothetical protein [Oscillospiraceae bacterium]
MKLKIGTYNIQHGVLHQKRLDTGEVAVDLAAVAAVIGTHAPDVCALNEIYGNEESRFGNQPRLLADMLGYPHRAFARGIYHTLGEYGNGLLSKYPITAQRVVHLCIPPEKRAAGARHYEDRALLVATLDVKGTPLSVLACHFGLNEDEMTLAVDTVLKEADAISTPLVLLGDFNFTPETVHYQRLAAALFDTASLVKSATPTFPSDAPARKIDYIFTRGLTVRDFICPTVVASDHLPLFTEIDF